MEIQDWNTVPLAEFGVGQLSPVRQDDVVVCLHAYPERLAVMLAVLDPNSRENEMADRDVGLSRLYSSRREAVNPKPPDAIRTRPTPISGRRG